MWNFKMLTILQSKSINNVYKLLQLLGDAVPQTPYQEHWTPLGGFPSPDLLGYTPQMKIPGTTTKRWPLKLCMPSLSTLQSKCYTIWHTGPAPTLKLWHQRRDNMSKSHVHFHIRRPTSEYLINVYHISSNRSQVANKYWSHISSTSWGFY